MASRDLIRALRQVTSVVLFGVLPFAVVGLVLRWAAVGPSFLSDFHGDLYSAGKAILVGHDPYRDAFVAHLATLAHPSTTFAVPVYPAPDLLVTAPLALLPYRAAAWLFTALGIGSLCLGLRLLGVRDWRCYGCAFLSWPVVHTLRLGQINEFLLLLAAIGWRWRASVIRPASALAAAVVGKLFLWPLVLFLVFRGRSRTAVLSIAIGVAGTLGGWAALGFAGFTAYPRLLSHLSAVEGRAGISFASWGAALGLGAAVATATAVGAAVALIALAWRALRRLPGDRGQRCAYGLLVVAGICSSSLVWPHYLVLLFVPIALLAPRFGPLWLVPLLAYLAPVELTHREIGNLLPYLAIELIVVAALIQPLVAENGLARARRRLHRLGAEGAVGRLGHGLRSTRFRSDIGAGRPTEGPSGPY